LKKDDYETVGKKMYETHEGLSKKYTVSCPELDFLNDQAKKYGVTGSRVMGGGFGGCTINLVKDDKIDEFVKKATEAYEKEFNIKPKVYDVVIKNGARKL
jgi:galactokinase